MSKLASVIKDEVQRLARKEIRAQTSSSKKLTAQHRRDLAALKRQVRDLTREVSYLQRQDAKKAGNLGRREDASNIRFSPSWVAAHRQKLELSAADYAALVGVSSLTIYNWEKGRTKPRNEQLAAWGAVRGLGKREAWKRLEAMEA